MLSVLMLFQMEIQLSDKRDVNKINGLHFPQFPLNPAVPPPHVHTYGTHMFEARD